MTPNSRSPMSFRRIAALTLLGLSALAAPITLPAPKPARAAVVQGPPPGWRYCKTTEINADPLHKVCVKKVWYEARNGGGRVRFEAYLRRINRTK